MRFLSHAETVRLFQRAISRAGLKVAYSRGFNPRPKISLPLPRTVGVESNGDLLCVRLESNFVEQSSGGIDSQIKEKLYSQMPQGCVIGSIELVKNKVSVSPVAATYVFPLQPGSITEQLTGRIDHLLAAKSLQITRKKGPKDRNPRNIDIREFIEGIELVGETIKVRYRITQAGSVRLDEVMGLLELVQENLSGPVKRTNVQWKII